MPVSISPESHRFSDLDYRKSAKTQSLLLTANFTHDWAFVLSRSRRNRKTVISSRGVAGTPCSAGFPKRPVSGHSRRLLQNPARLQPALSGRALLQRLRCLSEFPPAAYQERAGPLPPSHCKYLAGRSSAACTERTGRSWEASGAVPFTRLWCFQNMDSASWLNPKTHTVRRIVPARRRPYGSSVLMTADSTRLPFSARRGVAWLGSKTPYPVNEVISARVRFIKNAYPEARPNTRLRTASERIPPGRHAYNLPDRLP